MPIIATPTDISATYDSWAIQDFRQVGDGLADFGRPDAPTVRVMATLVKYRIRADGVAERSPLAEDRREITIDDVYAAAAADPVIADGMNGLLAAVFHAATVRGTPL